jgi:hypothetical protein
MLLYATVQILLIWLAAGILHVKAVQVAMCIANVPPGQTVRMHGNVSEDHTVSMEGATNVHEVIRVIPKLVNVMVAFDQHFAPIEAI